MAQQTRRRTVVLAHSTRSNALGRALSMADVAARLGTVQVVALDDGPLWAGATQFVHEVTVLRRNWRSQLALQLRQRDDGEALVVWISKGLAPLDRIAAWITSRRPDAQVILDIDDDDVGLAQEYRSGSALKHLKLNILRRGHPVRIKWAQESIAQRASGFTFSSWALGSLFPNFLPAARIPHVRTGRPPQAATEWPSEKRRFGCFGTIRPHKGGALMLDVARNFPDWRFYSFEDCGLTAKHGETITNWTQLPKDTPLHEAYGAIDVAFIPITSESRGARFQLPAKLIDAMSFGKCIVASSTPAISEFADGCYIELPADASPEDANEALRLALEANLGARAYDVFTKLLTPAAAALELTVLLERSGRRCEA